MVAKLFQAQCQNTNWMIMDVFHSMENNRPCNHSNGLITVRLGVDTLPQTFQDLKNLNNSLQKTALSGSFITGWKENKNPHLSSKYFLLLGVSPTTAAHLEEELTPDFLENLKSIGINHIQCNDYEVDIQSLHFENFRNTFEQTMALRQRNSDRRLLSYAWQEKVKPIIQRFSVGSLLSKSNEVTYDYE